LLAERSERFALSLRAAHCQNESTIVTSVGHVSSESADGALPFGTMLRRVAAESARVGRCPPSEFAARALLRRASAADIGASTRWTGVRHGQQRRSMSDNLLGHSPMARSVPTATTTATTTTPPTKPKSPGEAGPSWAPDANTTGGGVWAQTSAKRDKMGELKLELDWDKGQRTLDDAATEEQKWDLRLADGLRLVARATDGAWDADADADAEEDQDRAAAEAATEDAGDSAPSSSAGRRLGPSSKSHPLLVELDRWLTSTEESKRGEGEEGAESDSDSDSAELTRGQFEAHLSEVVRILSPGAHDAVPPGPIDALRHLRDFAEYDPDPAAAAASDEASGAREEEEGGGGEGNSARKYAPPPDVDADLSDAERPFDESVARLRLLLTRCAASHLASSWDGLASSSDADVDRAAVRGEEAAPRQSLPLSDVNAVLRSYAFGTCRDRLGAWWDLADREGDGALEQAAMDDAVYRALKPAEEALREVVAEALEVAAPRDPPTTWEEEGARRIAEAAEAAAAPEPEPKKGWRQRRREKKEKKRLTKMFDRTLANHFDVEVETPHRLRCVYAWAEKAHQDGKVDSVLVDSGGTIGRKRYVELQPKISLAEFQEVQGEHFAHIDRAGEELLSSFREDLLVHQGKGRQNRELRRDVFFFIAGVSLIDYGILML